MPISLAERVRALAQRPYLACMFQPEMFETGVGTVFVVREFETGLAGMAVFLVDTYALGIKDIIFRTIEPSELAEYLAMAHEASPLVKVTPSFARKLVQDAASYAASLGLSLHRSFKPVVGIFGDTRAEDCTENFTFGRDGKPYYAIGPTESVAQVERRLNSLTARLGPDGFHIAIPLSDGEYLTNEPDGPEGQADAA